MNVRLMVLRRDKYVCLMPVCLHKDAEGLEDRAIDRALKHPDPWAPTVDHIVPRAMFGSSEPANLRAAHAACNQYAAMVMNRRKSKRAKAARIADRVADPPKRPQLVLQDPEAVLGGPLSSWPAWETWAVAQSA
jgi:hypothetical protein